MEGMAIGHNLKKFTDGRRMPIADTGELKKKVHSTRSHK